MFAKESFKLPSFCYVGPPVFDDKGFYLGPLPMAKRMGSIRNRQSQGPFKTSGTEMWPAKMCQWISSMLLSSWASSATISLEGCSRETAEELADTFPICQPEGSGVLGGFGETSMTEGDSARQEGGGPRIGGIWRIVTAGLGYATSFSRKQLRRR